MDPQLPSPGNNDSDMADFFNDPRFDQIPSDFFGPAGSAFDRNPFLDTANDMMFEEALLKSQFVQTDICDQDTTHLPSDMLRRAQQPDPPLFTSESRHGSATSARSSSNEPSPDSRSALDNTTTDSESPPALTLRVAPPSKGNKSPAVGDTSMLNISTPQQVPLPPWSLFGNKVPDAFDPTASDTPFDNVLGPTFDSNPAAFLSTPGFAADNQVFLTSPVEAMTGTDYAFNGLQTELASRSTSQSTDQHASPSNAFAMPAASHLSAKPSDLFPPGVWDSDTAPWNDPATTLASSDALGLTPSPRAADRKMTVGGGTVAAEGHIPMHIAPIAAKSRVETQINIRMTLDYLPAGVTHVHLPTHTIAKSKLHAPDFHPSPETLEMHCMVVCTSAMHDPAKKRRALRKASEQDNSAIQAAGLVRDRQASQVAELDEDKPHNGGGVRICNNCINRERKRAARKKLKKEEEQAHWEKYETERIVVFNTHEHKPWQEWTKTEQPKNGDLPIGPIDLQSPAPDAMQIIAPMRIACYCRHQSEKEGFQVIFTLKDNAGTVVSQGMTDSILITDDHKAPTAATDQETAGTRTQQFLAGSQSMVNLPTQAVEIATSKSTGNLTGLKGRTTNQRQSLDPRGIDTSGTVTPRMLSRPPSPNGTQPGPAKKRKSMSGPSRSHRRVTSGLTMTRVETAQPHGHATVSNGGGAALTASGPLTPLTGISMSPTLGSPVRFNAMTAFAPPRPPQTHFQTHPPTPSETLVGGFQSADGPGGGHAVDQTKLGRVFSTPVSAQHSRPPSPSRFRAPDPGGPGRASSDGNGSGNGSRTSTGVPPASRPAAASERWSTAARPNTDVRTVPGAVDRREISPATTEGPRIDKLIPNRGPTCGGIEVSVYGANFSPGTVVLMGGVPCRTEFWASQCLCIHLPPKPKAGLTATSITTTGSDVHFQGPGPKFEYFKLPSNEELDRVERALRESRISAHGGRTWREMVRATAASYAREEPRDTAAARAEPDADRRADVEMQGMMDDGGPVERHG